MTPKPGDVVLVDGRASVQFAGDRAIVLRVISVSTRPTYRGFVWITGYQLDATGAAIAKREVFVQAAGLRPVTPPRDPRAGPLVGEIAVWPGDVVSVSAADRMYVAEPITLQVTRVRDELSRNYGGQWVWLEGYPLLPDGTYGQHVQVLARAAALPHEDPR